MAPSKPNCAHTAEKHNLIKTGGHTAHCPWCRIDALEARLRKAESMIADALSRWNARDAGYWREQLLRMQTYEAFLQPQENPDAE